MFSLVRGDAIDHEHHTENDYGARDWKKAKKILEEGDGDVKYGNEGKWKDLPEKEPEAMEKAAGINISKYGDHKKEMVNLRSRLKKVGYTIRGLDGK